MVHAGDNVGSNATLPLAKASVARIVVGIHQRELVEHQLNRCVIPACLRKLFLFEMERDGERWREMERDGERGRERECVCVCVRKEGGLQEKEGKGEKVRHTCTHAHTHTHIRIPSQ